jgi:cytochrome c oxidase cbb3-type subunit 4
MDKYSLLRELADSWVLLAMTLFYLAAILWVFRPSAKAIHDELSQMPLRNDDDPVLHSIDGKTDTSTAPKSEAK